MAQQITVSRPIPQQPRHSPWTGRFLLGLGLLVVATILASGIFAVVTNVSSSAPAQPFVVQPNPVVVPAPAADVPNPPVQGNIREASTPTTPVELELVWTNVGSARIGTKGNVQFPSLDKFFFISGPEIQANLKLPADGISVYRDGAGFFMGHGPGDKTAIFLGTEYRDNIPFFLGGGYGDGTAFFIQGHDGLGNEKYWFTPDRGAHWFKPANMDPGPSSTLPRDTVALIEGDTLVLYMSLQSEPNVDTYWRAEIPLATLEELSR